MNSSDLMLLLLSLQTPSPLPAVVSFFPPLSCDGENTESLQLHRFKYGAEVSVWTVTEQGSTMLKASTLSLSQLSWFVAVQIV